jgi:hypothetical protein
MISLEAVTELAILSPGNYREGIMNTVENSSKDRVRQETAAEILELGEMLFDTMIEVAQQLAQDKENDAPLIEGMRAAANEFFTALRLLLETWQETRISP